MQILEQCKTFVKQIYNKIYSLQLLICHSNEQKQKKERKRDNI